MTGYVHRTMILNADVVTLARSLAVGLAGPAAEGMWHTGLATTAGAAPTKYISAGMIEDTFAALLTDAAALYAACQSAGANVTLQQCQALVAGSLISESTALGAMASLGLVISVSTAGPQSNQQVK